MKLIKKAPHGNGHMYVYFMGIKVASYKPQCFMNGKNNDIQIKGNTALIYKIFGNNNKIVMEETTFNPHIYINIGDDCVGCDNCKIHFGRGVSIGSLEFLTPVKEDGTIIEVGDDCMFSFGVKFVPSDTHAIFNEAGELSNIAKHIKIGKHVWIGANATICKNTEIADGCVVGTGSVVSGKFLEPNCVLAGNPARVVKRNIKWDRRRPKEFM